MTDSAPYEHSELELGTDSKNLKVFITFLSSPHDTMLEMMILEALQTFFIALLVGYLSFTHTLAEHVMNVFHFEQAQTEVIIPSEAPSDELISISKLFASPNGIAQVLRGNDVFQRTLTEVRNEAALHDSTEIASSTILDALVNIFCEYTTGQFTRTVTGTGFFVGDNGAVLTNAHVAQFLLLEAIDTVAHDAECIIRSGNPATPRYRAELLFISPTWILNNAALITEEAPKGTGEYDYALLYISETLGEESHASAYPSLPIDTEFIPKSFTGTSVLTAGYPAERLLKEGARAKLEPKVAETTVEELYTFGSNYADIFSLSASSVGEHGASGGPVVDTNSGAVGLIVTKGNTETDGENSLRALTLSYINRTILEETGFTLEANSTGDLARRGSIFKEAMVPFLAQLLSFELER